MIQLSNNITMFATSTDQADTTYFFSIGIFLCPDESIVSNDIRLSIPYTQSLLKGMYCLLGRRWEETAFLVSVHFKFISSMTKQDEICNAANNSTCTATSAHETRAVQLTGNPFRDFSFYGLTLHGYHIKYWRGANRKNHSITGQFNISGRIETFGANSYKEAIEYVVFKIREHQAYIRERRKRKREQRIQA